MFCSTAKRQLVSQVIFVEYQDPNRNKNGKCLACNPKQQKIYIFWITARKKKRILGVFRRHDMIRPSVNLVTHPDESFTTKKNISPLRSGHSEEGFPSYPILPAIYSMVLLKKNPHLKNKKKNSPKKWPGKVDRDSRRCWPQKMSQKFDQKSLPLTADDKTLTVAPAIKLRDSSQVFWKNDLKV